ncbi:MAG: hypothetical protein N2Z67_01530 [Acetobacteraceae bacterium]|nr:hypothetical protein [Acetobacteraceae bacterium]
MGRRDLLPATLLALFGLGLHAALAVPDGRVLAGILPDTDSYARLIRVRELRGGAGWTDQVTPSLTAPEGLFLHGTLPLDVLILGPALALHAFGLPRDDAILWAGAVVCPVLHVAAALAAVWAARALLARRQASLLLICRQGTVRGEGFRARLLAGEVPPWLAPVPRPRDLAERARLFRVLPDPR